MTDFEKMQIISEQNGDIAMFPDLIELNKDKKGGTIKFGIPDPAFSKMMDSFAGKQTYYVVAYMINKEQFDKLK